METLIFAIVMFASLLSLSVVVVKLKWLRRQEVLEPELVRLSGYIKTGVASFIRRMYLTSGKIIGGIFIFLLLLALSGWLNVLTPWAVLSGAFFASLSSYFGMTAAARANKIVAYLTKFGLKAAFKGALNGGAVMGFSVCGFGLLDLAIWYLIIMWTSPQMGMYEQIEVLTSTVITFSFGASYIAFMARVSGGIYTKSADEAADTVGKGEFNLNEDDYRNPAVIADNTGDIASDVYGMGTDLNESFVGGNAASMEAGYQAAATHVQVYGVPSAVSSFHSTEQIASNELGAGALQTNSTVFGLGMTAALLVMLPLAISALGILASLIGLYAIRVKDNSLKELLKSVRRGVYLSSLLVVIGSFFIVYYTFEDLGYFWSVVIGLVTGNAISFVSEYHTSASYKPVQRLAEKANGGHASVVIEGNALGMSSVLYTAIVLVAGMIASYFVAGHGDYNLGLYGISLSAVSMLSTLPLTLTIDAFGPIADNAQGLLEMARIDGDRAVIGNNLDATGNTTAATGKGYAIGSAAFAAFVLVNALRHVINSVMIRHGIDASEVTYSIFDIWTISGIIIGVSVPWLFSARLLRAVGDTAVVMMNEIRRQFATMGILEGKSLPDYQKCIDISVKAAQKESRFPAFMVIFIPLIIGILGGPNMLLAYLLGALASGFGQAVFMANAGGAWDNAKKLIESGWYGGKNSPAHKAAITGDMNGDPYKDTAGPSLNILIKLMVTVSILAAPITIPLHFLVF
ncbi:MAG: sodium-translocating pyrophosphatase [Bacillota bacterium]